jgi:hypothetical protein
MVPLTGGRARFHPRDLSILWVMILIDAIFAGSLLTNFEPSLVEPSPHSVPSLGVQQLIARFQRNASIIALKASILLKDFDQNFVTGDRYKAESLARIFHIALVEKGFARVTGDLKISIKAEPRIRTSFKIVSCNAP